MVWNSSGVAPSWVEGERVASAATAVGGRRAARAYDRPPGPRSRVHGRVDGRPPPAKRVLAERHRRPAGQPVSSGYRSRRVQPAAAHTSERPAGPRPRPDGDRGRAGGRLRAVPCRPAGRSALEQADETPTRRSRRRDEPADPPTAARWSPGQGPVRRRRPRMADACGLALRRGITS